VAKVRNVFGHVSIFHSDVKSSNHSTIFKRFLELKLINARVDLNTLPSCPLSMYARVSLVELPLVLALITMQTSFCK